MTKNVKAEVVSGGLLMKKNDHMSRMRLQEPHQFYFSDLHSTQSVKAYTFSCSSSMVVELQRELREYQKRLHQF